MRNCFHGVRSAALSGCGGWSARHGSSRRSLDKSLAALSAVDKDGQRSRGGAAGNARSGDRPRGGSSRDPDGARPRVAVGGQLDSQRLRGVADRELRQKHSLPVAALEEFVRDKSHQPRARRLAYEWLVKVDPSAQRPVDSRHVARSGPRLPPRRRRPARSTRRPRSIPSSTSQRPCGSTARR